MKTINNYLLVLDIETSQKTVKIKENGVTVDKPSAVWLSYGTIKLYSVEDSKKYIDNIRFREWETLDNYLNYISNKFCGRKIICYVHNLSYEADFIFKNISKPLKMLCNSSHQVIFCNLEKFPNIDFKCSYMLSSMSLLKIGEIINYPKLESDYRTITPLDEITSEEWEYNERDCDIVARYIIDFVIPEFGTLGNIPYTKTGRVRKKFKEFYKISNSNKNWDLMPDEDCYNLLCDAFRGAITISNPKYTNRVIKNVHSFDEKSAYPYVMLKEKYPQVIKKIKGKPKTDYWISKVKFYNIDSKYNWVWLSRYKMQLFDVNTCEFYNGKLRWGDWIITTITNIDYDIIKLTYDFDKIEFIESAELYNIEYLPQEYIDTLLHFSKRKYELKNELKLIDENNPLFYEKSMDYMKSKNDFNSIYGMTVQKLMPSEYKIDNNFVWHEIEQKYKKIDNKHLQRNFLFGIFVTAYSRRNLILAIIKNCPQSFIYGDTDSIKYEGDKCLFVDTNIKLPDELNNIPSFHNLGQFEYECTYDKFLTFGAKKYIYEIDGILHMTVAGLPKKTKINNIKDFKIGKVFKNCKNAKMYIVNNTCFTYDYEYKKATVKILNSIETYDYLRAHNIKTAGGVALFPVDYKLNITKEDLQVLKNYNNEVTLYE